MLQVIPLLIGLAAFFALYHLALPRPLPHIPHNAAATDRLFGDLSNMKAARYRRRWIVSQPATHNSPVSQIMLLPFARPLVLVSDYRLVSEILSRRTVEFDRGTKTAECVGLTAPNFHLVLNSRDPRFKVQRELLRDLMSPLFLEQVAAPRSYERALLLVDLWSRKANAAAGRPFGARNDLYMATLDIICSVAFGLEQETSPLRREIAKTAEFAFTLPERGFATDVREVVEFPTADRDPEMDALLDIPAMTAVAQASPFPWLAQRWALRKPTHARGWFYRRTLITKRIRHALPKIEASRGEDVGSSKTALELLLRREAYSAKRAGRHPDYYSAVIRDEVLGFLLAGHDSTATTLSWWVKYMTRYQHVQTRLRRSIRDAFPQAAAESRDPTVSEISSMAIPYLNAVLEETLRFAASITLTVRRAVCDTEILNYPIPKGTDVMLCLTGPSIRQPSIITDERVRAKWCRAAKSDVPDWGKDIELFHPDRWLKVRMNSAGTMEESFDPHELKTVMILLIWMFVFEEVPDHLNTEEMIEKMVNLPRDCNIRVRKWPEVEAV